MANYKLVPYIVQFRIHRTSKSNALLLDNLDKKGLQAFEVIKKALASLAKKGDLKDKVELDKTHRIINTKSYGGFLIKFDIEPGTSGIVSTLFQKDGTQVKRTSEDVEYVPLRHAFYLPKGGYTGVLLAERVGHHGSVEFLRGRIHELVRSHYPSMTIDISPITSLELADNICKAISFTMPKRKDSQGRLLDYGLTISAGLPSQVRVRDLLSKKFHDKFDKNAVFAKLNEVLIDKQGAELSDDGGKLSITVVMGDGKEKTFSVDAGGPKLAFILNNAEFTTRGRSVQRINPLLRPDDYEFFGFAEDILASNSLSVIGSQNIVFPSEDLYAIIRPTDVWEVDKHGSPQ